MRFNSSYALEVDKNSTDDLVRISNAVSGIQVNITAHSDDLYLQSQLASPDNFEPAVSVGKHVLTSDSVILDVGACLGFVSTALGQIAYDGRVIAVEANPQLIEGLWATAAAYKNLEVVHLAVGEGPGQAEYHMDANGGAWGYVAVEGQDLQAPATSTVVPVKQTSIDSLCRELALEQLDFIKLDVEGSEVHALNGAKEVLDRFEPIAVVELNPFCLWRYGRTLPQDLTELMSSQWPYLYSVAPDGAVEKLGDNASISHLFASIGVNGGLVDLVGSPTELDLPENLQGLTESAKAETPGDPRKSTSKWNLRRFLR